MLAPSFRLPVSALVPFALAAALATALETPAAAQDLKWPPVGPTWETVPAKAFAKAREQRKAVMVYVATEGCPHCVVMARETWPTPEVKAVNDDVVFLAVHRNNDKDWTARLDVIAYPQTLFVDGWGELLPKGRDQVFIRDKEQLVKAVKAFAGEVATTAKERTLPEALAAVVAKKRIADATSPDCDVRLALWRELLPKLTPAQLMSLFGWETDAVARLEAVRAMPRDAANRGTAIELANAAVADGNDYVRQEAIALLGASGGPEAAKVLTGVIEKVLAGKSGYSNPNNMLCAATQAAKTVCEPSLVEPLAAVLRKEKANNSATHLAVGALAAIGKKHGRDKVRAALEVALTVEGANAERLHQAAKAALQD